MAAVTTTAVVATTTAATAMMTAATVATTVAIDEMWIGETEIMTGAILTGVSPTTGATLTGAITTVSERRIDAGVTMGSARGLTVKSFKGLLLRHRLH